ncbi:MAG: hypothetical protein PHH60_03845, partial [Candidatus Margulisbacteria bacterium]|nr:hypothetical protein [Candidatus Margulisiibacteriota bacterium]
MIRKKTSLCFLALLIFLAGSAAEESAGDSKMDNKKIVYQIMWNGDNLKGEVRVNGFLITKLNGQQTTGTAPLNPWLIGENEVQVEVYKANRAKTADFLLGVSELGLGEIAQTNERGNLVSVEIKDRDLAGPKPVKISRQFRSTLNFSRHFLEAGATGESGVIAYAKAVYKLFEQKDVNGIMQALVVKIEDYKEAFYSESMAEEFKAYLENEILKGKLARINPAKLKAEKVGPGKNLWHILESDKELIRT